MVSNTTTYFQACNLTFFLSLISRKMDTEEILSRCTSLAYVALAAKRFD